MDSRMWPRHEYDHRRFYSSDQNHQVDLTLRLGFPNTNGDSDPLAADIDHNKPPFSTPLHHNMINHHALQPHQVMVNNHGLASNGEMMMSEANYNPHQIVWSKELKTYVLKSSNSYSNSSSQQVRGSGSTANNLPTPNLPLQNNNNDLYTLLNPASRIPDNDHEAETSSAARRKGSRRRKVSTCNEPEKRCTNYNCNTNFTPMWRKGPLGPKSLCNACGIRYRKESLNKEAMAGENSQS